MVQNQYKCDGCGATFDTKEELEEHKRVMHSQYKCESCGQSFNSKNDLEEHERAMHPEKEESSAS